MFYELSNGDTYTCAGLGSRKGGREREGEREREREGKGGLDESHGVALMKMEDMRIIEMPTPRKANPK